MSQSGADVEVRGQLASRFSFRRVGSGDQAWWPTSLSTEPSQFVYLLGNSLYELAGLELTGICLPSPLGCWD